MRVGITFLSFGKDVFAGIENSLYNLARGLIANNASVHVYSGFLAGRDAELDGILIYRSASLPSALPEGDATVHSWLNKNRREITSELARFVVERDLDFLYVCDPLWGIVQSTEAWKAINCPMLLSLHVLNTPDLLEDAQRTPFRIYTAVSDGLKSNVLERVALSPFVTVPNSIDITRFRPQADTRRSTVVLCNARMSPEKGIIDLVRAFPRVVRAVPGAELWLCSGAFPFGDAPTHISEIMNEAKTVGVAGSLRLLPKLPWSEIAGVIHQSEVVVLPSHRETFGLGALEAMACGKPVVATRVGNLPALIGDAGILVPPQSPRELGDAIVRVLTDASLGSALGAVGVRRAGQFSNERVARQVLELMASH